jgi:hypothetical protein
VTFTVFAVLVAVTGLMVRGERLVSVQVLSCLLGATAAVTLPALGDACVTVPWFFSVFLVARAWLGRGPEQPWFQLSRPSLWILLTACWGILVTYFVPRWFAGSIEVLTVDRNSPVREMELIPLRPVSGHITQSVYALGGALGFVAMRAAIQRYPNGMARFRDAVLLLGCLDCVGALLHLGEYYLGLPELLPYVRTGTYRIFSSYESAGLVRIQGTFAETAAFAAFTLPLFAFAAELWARGERPRYSGAVAATTLIFLLLSTSATAYAGLIGYLTFLAGVRLWKAMFGQRIRRVTFVAALLLFLVSAAGIAYAFELRPAMAVARFIEFTIFKKMDSPSGVERSIWNAHAWATFLDSYGLGAGLGSARASSLVLVLLSNVGLVGTVLFGGFVFEVLRSRSSTQGSATVHAARQAVVASLIAAAISGAVYDMGICFYAFCAAASCGAVAHAASRVQLGSRPLLRAPVLSRY